MFSFRTKSIKNDKDLKTRHAQYNITQLQNQAHSSSHNSDPPFLTPVYPIPQPSSVVPIPAKYKHAHKSLRDIARKYPNLKLPELPLKSHFAPYITLLQYEVHDWFKETQNLSHEKTERIIARAAEALAPKPKQLYGPQSAQKRAAAKLESESRPAKRKSAEKVGTPRSSHLDIPSTSHTSSKQTLEKTNSKPKSKTVDGIKSERPSSVLRKPCPIAQKNVPTKSESGKKVSKVQNGEFQESERRKSTNRRTSRPITYNEDLAETIRLSPQNVDDIAHQKKQQEAARIAEAKNSRSATAITSTLADPDSDSDEITIPNFVSPSSSRSSTPSINIQMKDPLEITPNISNNGEKNDFARMLALTPRTDTISPNQEGTPGQDLLVLSQRNKTQSLHTCKVCDSHFYSSKDLKKHERKTHTKCAYCNKKFGSLASRDEHMKDCDTLKALTILDTQTLRDARLQLQRVDEMPELRAKYASAFQEPDVTEETECEEAQIEPDVPVAAQTDVPVVIQSDVPVVERVVRAMEQDLSNAKTQEAVTNITPGKPQAERPNIALPAVVPVEKSKEPAPTETPTVQASEKSASETLKFAPKLPMPLGQPLLLNGHLKLPVNNINKRDVICISDEEGDPSIEMAGTGKPKLNLLHPEILRGVDLSTCDADLVKNILIEVDKTKRDNRIVFVEALKNNPITFGANSKTRIFKNLRQHLNKYQIPVEIAYKPEMHVSYKMAKHPPPYQTTGSWISKPARDINGIVAPNGVYLPTKVATIATTVPGALPQQQSILLNGFGSPSVTAKDTQLYHMLKTNNPPKKTTANTNFVMSASSSQAIPSSSVFQNNAPVTNYTPSSGGSVSVNSASSAPRNSSISISTAQGPLPVIQSVVSVNKAVVAPSIRVRPLQELS